MNTQDIKQTKIFITGISASGKTHLAKKLAKEYQIEYCDFDSIWDYNNINTKNHEKEFLSKLPNSFIVDAVPYSLICVRQYDSFHEYKKENTNILVICTFQSNLTLWMKNILSKDFYTVLNYNEKNELIPNPIFQTNFWDAWMYFYTSEIDRIKPTVFYDNSKNQWLSYKEFENIRNDLMIEIVNKKFKNQHLFKDYLDTFDPKLYDKFYQDIECINFIGYSKSYKTWENIKNLVDWKNKTVIDCGCYHGYFSFKAEQMGASKIIGLEKWNTNIETTLLLKKILRSNAEFLLWEAGEPTPDGDIALILNVLHHAKDQEKTLQNINTKMAIFEVEKSQVELIKKYFTIIKEVESHRVDPGQNRIILLTIKREQYGTL